MATNETGFKNEILAILKTWPKAHAFKAQMAVLGGVADLYTCTPEFGVVWIEAKFDKRNASLVQATLGLTQLQRSFIRRENEAGGCAGWALCVKMGSGEEVVFAGRNHATTTLRLNSPEHVYTKRRGEKHDVRKILQVLREAQLQSAEEPNVETHG